MTHVVEGIPTHVHCDMYVIIFILYKKNSDPESQQKSAFRGQSRTVGGGCPGGAL